MVLVTLPQANAHIRPKIHIAILDAIRTMGFALETLAQASFALIRLAFVSWIKGSAKMASAVIAPSLLVLLATTRIHAPRLTSAMDRGLVRGPRLFVISHQRSAMKPKECAWRVDACTNGCPLAQHAMTMTRAQSRIRAMKVATVSDR